MPQLFDPVSLGSLILKNRAALVPMTRARGRNNIPYLETSAILGAARKSRIIDHRRVRLGGLGRVMVGRIDPCKWRWQRTEETQFDMPMIQHIPLHQRKEKQGRD